MKLAAGALVWLLLAAHATWAAEAITRIEVVTLKYRTTEEVMPVIRPLLAPEGRVSGAHNQLIIRSTPDNLRELLPVIRHLDAPARQLVLHVEQGESSYSESRRAQLDAAIGDRNRVEIGQPREPNSIVARIGAGSGSGENTATQRIQTLDGRAAHIRTGKLIPILTTSLDGHGHPITQVDHQSADKGIWVTPRLVGDNEVELEISTRHDDEDGQSGRLQTRRSESTVRGRLGEWIALGGTGDDGRSSSRALSGASRTTTHREFGLRVKVELVQ